MYDLHSPEGYKARESEGLSVMLVMLVSYVEEPKATSKLLHHDTMKLLCIYAACDGW